MCCRSSLVSVVLFLTCGVATISRRLKIICLFCKITLWKRRYSVKETYNFKAPTHCSHLILYCYSKHVTYTQYLHKQHSEICDCVLGLFRLIERPMCSVHIQKARMNFFRQYSRVSREVGCWGRVPFSKKLMSPTPRRKWYLTTGRRAH